MLLQKYFYTVEPIKKKVSNDFELANRWPYSVVAHTWAYSDDPPMESLKQLTDEN
ncbi:MAG TPA: hypothetical protein GX712_00640 [Bacteroidales bacterium]|nr:hypothetical protein [Bacteroidales bacterium]